MDDVREHFVGPALRPGGRPSPSLVVPGLLIGEYPTPADVPWLRTAHGVTAVVSLQDDADLAAKRLRLADLERAYAGAGIAFHRLPVGDGDTDAMAAALGDVVALVERLVGDGACVYLHCNAGLNRAPTAAIAWLHAARGLPLAAAAAHVKARRACVPYLRLLDAHFARR
ncbi:MAG TPA: dual specificity protein phosphatase family protein [Candidatus Binatia bacterium]|jgi:atypical dual specificity phosphatase|nr:dual specificity protein phosphatase family protein [Candidatus Binatia bacterium]